MSVKIITMIVTNQTPEAEAPPGKVKLGCVVACFLALCLLLLILNHPAIQSARFAAPRSLSKSQLKTLGIGFRSYRENAGHLPLENSGHSWETSLLPFIGEASLYSQIDLSRPWDDPINKSPFQQPVQILLNPLISQRTDDKGYAYSHYAINSQWIRSERMLDFDVVTDGLANTILAGEISDGFQPWGKPGNARDPALGLTRGPNSFGFRPDMGTYMLMGDGSVRSLSENTDPNILKSLATPAGGEKIPNDDW